MCKELLIDNDEINCLHALWAGVYIHFVVANMVIHLLEVKYNNIHNSTPVMVVLPTDARGGEGLRPEHAQYAWALSISRPFLPNIELCGTKSVKEAEIFARGMGGRYKQLMCNTAAGETQIL